jgi:hypothetical protein
MPADTRRTIETLALADATLAGGARLVGGTYITTAEIQTIALGGHDSYGGVCWDPDGLHIWHARFAEAGDYLKKWRVSDGAEITASRVAPGGTLRAVTRDSLDKLIVAGYGSSKIYVVDPVTLAVTTITPSPANAPYVAVRDSAGNFWTLTAVGACAEFGPDGTATTRTVAGTWTGLFVHPDIPGYIYLFSAASIKRIAIAPGLAETVYTVATSGYGLPGEATYYVSGCTDSAGKVYAWTALRYRIDRWPAAGGACEATAVWPDLTHGVDFLQYDSAIICSPFCAFTDDDQWLAWKTTTTGGSIRHNAIRARCVGPQTVVFRRAAATKSVTVRRITVPGYSGNDATYQPTAYATSVAGAAYVAAADGADCSVALAVGQTLDVKVTFTMLGVPPRGDPTITGPVVLEIEDASAVEYPTSGVPASATTLTAIRTNYTAALEALTPTLKAGSLFHNSTMTKWLDGGRPDDLRLFRWDFGRPFGGYESEDLGVCDYSCRFVREHLTLRVAYPKQPTMYPALVGGNADDAMEAVVVADATQLQDALRTALNYLPAMTACNPEFQIDRGAESSLFWLLVFDCAIEYYRAQTVL